MSPVAERAREAVASILQETLGDDLDSSVLVPVGSLPGGHCLRVSFEAAYKRLATQMSVQFAARQFYYHTEHHRASGPLFITLKEPADQPGIYSFSLQGDSVVTDCYLLDDGRWQPLEQPQLLFASFGDYLDAHFQPLLDGEVSVGKQEAPTPATPSKLPRRRGVKLLRNVTSRVQGRTSHEPTPPRSAAPRPPLRLPGEDFSFGPAFHGTVLGDLGAVLTNVQVQATSSMVAFNADVVPAKLAPALESLHLPEVTIGGMLRLESGCTIPHPGSVLLVASLEPEFELRLSRVVELSSLSLSIASCRVGEERWDVAVSLGGTLTVLEQLSLDCSIDCSVSATSLALDASLGLPSTLFGVGVDTFSVKGFVLASLFDQSSFQCSASVAGVALTGQVGGGTLSMSGAVAGCTAEQFFAMIDRAVGTQVQRPAVEIRVESLQISLGVEQGFSAGGKFTIGGRVVQGAFQVANGDVTFTGQFLERLELPGGAARFSTGELSVEWTEDVFDFVIGGTVTFRDHSYHARVGMSSEEGWEVRAAVTPDSTPLSTDQIEAITKLLGTPESLELVVAAKKGEYSVALEACVAPPDLLSNFFAAEEIKATIDLCQERRLTVELELPEAHLAGVKLLNLSVSGAVDPLSASLTAKFDFPVLLETDLRQCFHFGVELSTGSGGAVIFGGADDWQQPFGIRHLTVREPKLELGLIGPSFAVNGEIPLRGVGDSIAIMCRLSQNPAQNMFVGSFNGNLKLGALLRTLVPDVQLPGELLTVESAELAIVPPGARAFGEPCPAGVGIALQGVCYDVEASMMLHVAPQGYNAILRLSSFEVADMVTVSGFTESTPLLIHVDATTTRFSAAVKAKVQVHSLPGWAACDVELGPGRGFKCEGDLELFSSQFRLSCSSQGVSDPLRISGILHLDGEQLDVALAELQKRWAVQLAAERAGKLPGDVEGLRAKANADLEQAKSKKAALVAKQKTLRQEREQKRQRLQAACDEASKKCSAEAESLTKVNDALFRARAQYSKLQADVAAASRRRVVAEVVCQRLNVQRTNAVATKAAFKKRKSASEQLIAKLSRDVKEFEQCRKVHKWAHWTLACGPRRDAARARIAKEKASMAVVEAAIAGSVRAEQALQKGEADLENAQTRFADAKARVADLKFEAFERAVQVGQARVQEAETARDNRKKALEDFSQQQAQEVRAALQKADEAINSAKLQLRQISQTVELLTAAAVAEVRRVEGQVRKRVEAGQAVFEGQLEVVFAVEKSGVVFGVRGVALDQKLDCGFYAGDPESMSTGELLQSILDLVMHPERMLPSVREPLLSGNGK